MVEIRISSTKKSGGYTLVKDVTKAYEEHKRFLLKHNDELRFFFQDCGKVGAWRYHFSMKDELECPLLFILVSQVNILSKGLQT